MFSFELDIWQGKWKAASSSSFPFMKFQDIYAFA